MSGRGLTRKDFLAALMATGTTAGLSGCSAERAPTGADGVVNFSVFSGERAKALSDLWQPVLSDMRQQTGLNIQPYLASDEDSLIRALSEAQVQAGWFSNASGLAAIRSGQAEIFAQAVYPEGFGGPRSVIVTRAGSRLTLEDLLQCDGALTLGMGEAHSIAATQAPYHYLFLPGAVDMSTCFKRVSHGSPARHLTEVINGRLDAATHSSVALTDLALRDPQTLSQIRVIWESPELPADVLIVRKDLDPVIKEKLRAFFLAYGRAPGDEGERQRASLTRLALGGFIPADDTSVLPTRLMEASARLMQAHQKGKAEDIRAAMDDLRAIQKEKADYDARIVPQAPADPI